MKKILLIAAFLPLLLWYGCKEEPTYPTYLMDAEFKSYIDFPVGSYWIYSDSISGQTDSIYVEDIQCGIGNNTEDFGRYNEFYRTEYWSSAMNKTFRSMTSYIEARTDSFFMYSIIYGAQITSENEISVQSVYSGYYENFVVDGQNYESVKEFTFYTSSYWCPYIGMIKTIERNNSGDTIAVWNLKRYFINN